MRDPLHDLCATVNPKPQKMLQEVQEYRAVIRAHLLAVGDDWDSVVPVRKANNVFQRFKFTSNRFDELLAAPGSKDRDLALNVLHEKMYRLCSAIEWD